MGKFTYSTKITDNNFLYYLSKNSKKIVKLCTCYIGGS